MTLQEQLAQAEADRDKVFAHWRKVAAEWRKARADWRKADADRADAAIDFDKANDKIARIQALINQGGASMKYRKKPVVVEAVQWFKMGDHPAVGQNGATKGIVQTLEGPMTVTPGDYIITGVMNEVYPCKPDIFEMTYEPVEEQA